MTGLTVFKVRGHTRTWLSLCLGMGAGMLTLGACYQAVSAEGGQPGAGRARVYASAQTQPTDDAGDAADDPAIWFNVKDPSKSLVLGTNKKSGLGVYDLAGTRLTFLPVGRINNVDVRNNITFERNVTMDIAAASHRTKRGISVFAVGAGEGNVGSVRELPGSPVITGLDEPYGLCMMRDPVTGSGSVFVNSKDGRIERWDLYYDGTNISGKLAGTMKLSSQVEGMVVDEATGTLFVGEEAAGVWAFNIAQPTAPPVLVAKADPAGPLVADVEGVVVVPDPANGRTLLVVSSQGNNTYIVYNAAAPYAHISTFEIAATQEGVRPALGAVEETDGIDISVLNFGGAFAGGLMVAQDGINGSENQNFKYVAWAGVQAAIEGKGAGGGVGGAEAGPSGGKPGK